jgi:hypothetical protein
MENKLAKFGSLPIYLLLFIIFLGSCKPSKVTNTVSEKIRIDTIINEKTIVKFNAIHDTLLIDNPCDSAGILTTFYSKITLPQGKVVIRSYKGKIQATVNIDSIANVYESKYKSKVNTEIKYINKEVIKYRIPTWVIILLMIEVFALAAWLYIKFIFKRL